MDYYKNKFPKRKSNNEHKLQMACVGWFRLNYKLSDIVLASFPNEGKRDFGQGDKLKKLGLLPGMPDLILIANNKVRFIELKYEDGKISNEQKEVHEKLKSNGFEVSVIRSFDEFTELVKSV